MRSDVQGLEQSLHGLNSIEAERRLLNEGPNELVRGRKRSVFALIFDVLCEPMLLLLVAAATIYLLLGDLLDALVLSVFAGFTIAVEIVQEGRADRAIEALRDLSAPRAMVIREGQRKTIPAREVVREDLLVIAEGDRIGADGWIVEADAFSADESMLTGESVAVLKRPRDPGDIEPPGPGGDGLPYAFAGTLAVRGHAVLQATATGVHSRMAQIGLSLATLDEETPRLTLQSRRLVRWFAVFGIGVSVLVAVLYGFFRGGWMDALLAGIALAMSMLPEELPVVLTLFMTMGALRMSRARVLARRGATIESLGATTVLCTDKTGTLTHNRMEIAELRLPDGRRFEPGGEAPLIMPQAFVDLAGLGLLACLEQPFDPMESAFHELGARSAGSALTWRQEEGWALRRQFPLSPELLAVSHVWAKDDEHQVVAAKGAPEAIAEMCRLTPEARADMEKLVGDMARGGLRVLAVAEAPWGADPFPESQRDFEFAFRGLVGLADPIRETVPPAIAQLQRAGVRVIMITGDYPETAMAIARRAGIREGAVLTGPEVSRLDDAALAERVRDVAVLARVMPEQKLRIVEALKHEGDVVAMIGDGVNDAPSLKAAHIGVAMGRRGTDVAREAAAIVLLDDDFATIPLAMRLGRRIYDNLRKAMGFIFAVHIPIGGVALAPLIAGWPIILGPMHIAVLELIIDPVCALAYEAEPEEPGIMDRPPRDPATALFPRRLLLWSVGQGVLALVLLLGLAAWAHDRGEMRSVVFGGLVATVLVLVLVNRTFAAGSKVRPRGLNLPLLLIMAGALSFFAVLFTLPAMARLFRLVRPGWSGLLAVAVCAGALLAILALAKRHFRDEMTA